MQSNVPPELNLGINQGVLNYLHGKSAHSDCASLLHAALKPLGDVQVLCPNPQTYSYVAASTLRVIFGFAVGMDTVAFRLDPRMKERALDTGAIPCPECGDAWVEVIHRLPDSDWPAVDVVFSARKAYTHARELACQLPQSP